MVKTILPHNMGLGQTLRTAMHAWERLAEGQQAQQAAVELMEQALSQADQ